MDAIRTPAGFTGTLAQFFELSAHRPPLRAGRAANGCASAITRSAGGSTRGSARSSRPSRAPALEIREVEAFRERNEAGGSYQDGTPDGSRPGIFYYNAYDLPSRRTYGMETLYLHEGAPGHHFQISLARRMRRCPTSCASAATPPSSRAGRSTPRRSWDELGMETDPYQRFGGLNDEMLRAMRLVVDTGIHAKGWTREQAIRYMLDNSGMSETEVTAEVERYIAIPGQALAYKIGQLEDPRAARRAPSRRSAALRPPRVPRPGADDRRAAADRARAQDRRLDRQPAYGGALGSVLN